MKAKKVISRPKKLDVTAPVKAEYDQDFYKWAFTQAKLLKKKEFEKIDVANLIEELESLGRSDKRSLKSYLENLLLHLLKMEYQPHGKGTSRSWEGSIFEARSRIKDLLEDSPSLKKLLPALIPNAYIFAKHKAMAETGIPLETFPLDCPWKKKEILDD